MNPPHAMAMRAGVSKDPVSQLLYIPGHHALASARAGTDRDNSQGGRDTPRMCSAREPFSLPVVGNGFERSNIKLLDALQWYLILQYET